MGGATGASAMAGASMANMIMVPVEPERLCLAGLTTDFTEEDAKELVEVFGDVKFWHCIRFTPQTPVPASVRCGGCSTGFGRCVGRFEWC